MAKIVNRLRFFRLIDGHKVPHVMELDETGLVMREYVAVEDPNLPQSPAKRERPGSTPEHPVNVKATKRALLMTKWTSETTEENPIPGTDELRKAYFRDLDELKKIYDNEPCPVCKIVALQRAYRRKLENEGVLE